MGCGYDNESPRQLVHRINARKLTILISSDHALTKQQSNSLNAVHGIHDSYIKRNWQVSDAEETDEQTKAELDRFLTLEKPCCTTYLTCTYKLGCIPMHLYFTNYP